MKTMAMSLFLASVTAKSGTESMCLGTRPHIVTYDFTGEMLKDVENATISVKPDFQSTLDCSDTRSIHYGNKTMCVGANVDSTCTKAAKVIALNSCMGCTNCFAGLTTDLYYSLKVELFKLVSVEIGLQNSHLRGAAEIHGHADRAASLPPHSITLVDDKSIFKANFLIADVFPVDITVSVPTQFIYEVNVTGSVDATAGADLDVNLGDHSIKWQDGSFSFFNTSSSYNFMPKLDVDVAAQAALSLKLDSKVEISIDKVASYDVLMQPSFPLKVNLDSADKKVCIAGSADVVLSHAADVHFTLFGKDHEIYHYGPKVLYHYHEENVLNKCVNLAVVV